MKRNANQKPWEDTVVTAMRDEKWLHALRHRRGQNIRVPLPQLKLKGNAEQRLGDILDATDDRFFLFEVKATRNDIKSEWNTNNKDNDSQKDAFRAHRSWLSNPDAPENNDLLWKSMLGHFFAYWVEYLPGQEMADIPVEKKNWRDLLHVSACVAIEPYALACTSFRDKQRASAKVGALPSNHRVAIHDEDAKMFRTRQQIPLSLIYEDLGFLIKEDTTPPINTASSWELLGLELPAFKKYIENLCSFAGKSEEPIHAVVMSASGNFFQIATSTSDLKKLLLPSAKSDLPISCWPEDLRKPMRPIEKAKLLNVPRKNNPTPST